MSHPSLSTFHPVIATWFERTYGEPSPPQAQGWPLIAAGENVLLLAPTGSGKTFAAFLKCLDWLCREAEAGRSINDGVSILYISPLKALNNDIHRNLEVPLQGIAAVGEELGIELPLLTRAVRTGDTPAAERRRMLQKPPQILITTPESLFLMLSSQARRILQTVRYVIVDEIHTLFPTKRGAHLALSLERLQRLAGDRGIQRIGLSATMRPLDQIAAFLGGNRRNDGIGEPVARPVIIVDTGQRKELDLRILLPVPDLKELPEKTIWPEIYDMLLQLVNGHQTTLIFVNNRRQAERITASLNQLAGRELARTHHGSVSKEVRLEAEELLKTGKLPCVVATASLELGIDIGYIDLVIQIESPKEVARGLQRVGRAGHIVGMPSKGRIIPKTRADLLEAAAVVREMKAGRVEPAQAPLNCLDILAQQLVAMTSEGEWPVAGAYQTVRSAYNFRNLCYADFEKVLEMLSGNFNTAEFVELRPRLYWDRAKNVIREDPYGKRLIYSSGGTIPDRGYFGVYLAGSGVKLGELDEEFVYERRLNERFVLGTSTWRIEEIRQDRVMVAPARKGEAYIPFWKADEGGRVFELGKRIGAFYGEVEEKLETEDFNFWLETQCGTDGIAARNIKNYLAAQKQSVGYIQTDRRLVLEEYPDEAGEWRVIIHSPFGSRLHMALGHIIKDYWYMRYGYEVEVVANDEAILFHCPGGKEPPGIEWDDIRLENLEQRLAQAVGGSVLFGTVFRHTAQRSLVLPRPGYGKKRMPLWLARLKAGNLLQIVAKYPDFPLITETYREIFQDFFDLTGLREVVTGIRQGRIAVHHCRHQRPSPFAMAHLLNFVGSFMYESGAPKGESRWQLFGLGHETLKTIVGKLGFRELFDPDLIREVDRKARGLHVIEKDPSREQLQQWLERVGDVTLEELETLFPVTRDRVKDGLEQLLDSGRAVYFHFGPGCQSLIVAKQEVPVYRTALGEDDYKEPIGLPGDEKSRILAKAEARRSLMRRFTRTHGPFTTAQIANRYQFKTEEVAEELSVLAAAGVIEAGEFIPGGSGEEWCDVGLLQELHRRSLAKARKEIEARTPKDYTAFLARWQKVHPFGETTDPTEQVCGIIKQLSNLWLPADIWEKSVLPGRLSNYQTVLLDQLIGSGQFVWRAASSGSNLLIRFEPGWNDPESMIPRSPAGSGPVPPREKSVFQPNLSDNSLRILDLLSMKGALSLPQLLKHTGLSSSAAWVALEDLIIVGLISNDTFGPVRYLLNTSKENRRGVRGIMKLALMNTMGRWSLLGPMDQGTPENLAYGLLNRYGVISREAVSAENLNWDELYPVLDLLESTGKIRRGYFIQGLSGIQYALPEAVEQLRQELEMSLWVLAWQDPANAYRLFPEWPGIDLSGTSTDYIIYLSGEPILAGGGKRMKIQQLADLSLDILEKALRQFFKMLYRVYPDEKITVVQYNGQPVNESEAGPVLVKLGLEKGYNDMTLWPSQRS